MTLPVSRDPSFGPPALARAPAPSPAPATAGVSGGPSPFARLLSGLGHEVQRGETLVRQAEAAPPSTMGASELIALQVGVCRYSEAVDLASRLIDHASSAVKTVVEGQ